MHAWKVDEATGDRALRAPAYSAGPHLASTDMTDGEAARDASFRALHALADFPASYYMTQMRAGDGNTGVDAVVDR
jgi:hypothetical protein